MSCERGRATGRRDAVAVALGCLLTCSCTATTLAADMPGWVPIGAQPFRFGDDGRAELPEVGDLGDTSGLAFRAPNGELNAIVTSIRRVWLQGAADADSLAQPPRDRELGIVVSLTVNPSGGDRWTAGHGYGRIELGLVDSQGRSTHTYRARTPGHPIYYIGYCGMFVETLTFHVVPLPETLPVEGYVRADAMPGGEFSMSWDARDAWKDVFPEGYEE